MSDPNLSDIDFKNRMAWIWTTIKIVSPGRTVFLSVHGSRGIFTKLTLAEDDSRAEIQVDHNSILNSDEQTNS